MKISEWEKDVPNKLLCLELLDSGKSSSVLDFCISCHWKYKGISLNEEDCFVCHA